MRNRVPCRWSVRGSRIAWRAGSSTGPGVRPSARWPDEPTATGPHGHRRPSLKITGRRTSRWMGRRHEPSCPKLLLQSLHRLPDARGRACLSKTPLTWSDREPVHSPSQRVCPGVLHSAGAPAARTRVSISGIFSPDTATAAASTGRSPPRPTGAIRQADTRSRKMARFGTDTRGASFGATRSPWPGPWCSACERDTPGRPGGNHLHAYAKGDATSPRILAPAQHGSDSQAAQAPIAGRLPRRAPNRPHGAAPSTSSTRIDG